jgi:hypothetical protein
VRCHRLERLRPHQRRLWLPCHLSPPQRLPLHLVRLLLLGLPLRLLAAPHLARRQ